MCYMNAICSEDNTRDAIYKYNVSVYSVVIGIKKKINDFSCPNPLSFSHLGQSCRVTDMTPPWHPLLWVVAAQD